MPKKQFRKQTYVFRYEKIVVSFLQCDNLKMLVLYNEHKPVKGFFNFHGVKAEGIYTDVYLAPLDAKQMFLFDSFFDQKKRHFTCG